MRRLPKLTRGGAGISGAAPLFVDLAAGNFRQLPKSPAFKFGAFARPGRK